MPVNTTYNPGELNALSGGAGAYAEHVPRDIRQSTRAHPGYASELEVGVLVVAPALKPRAFSAPGALVILKANIRLG